MPDNSFAELDNPAWHALNGRQAEFAVGNEFAKRYQHGVLPFAAYDYANADKISSLEEWINPGDVFFLIGDLPALPKGWVVEKELPCAQMIFTGGVKSESNPLVTALDSSHRKEIFDLVQKVQPGYYEMGTQRLGDYFGIRDGDRLVAVGGERMKLANISELSAICTDAAYTGRGYARDVMVRLSNINVNDGCTPVLHVLESNLRAIGLYEYLGFVRRRGISFWKMRRF